LTVLRKVSKALSAGIGAGIAAWVVANQVGGVSTEEWGGIVGAVLFTGFVTFLAPKNEQPA
jgi:hypothetical protein